MTTRKASAKALSMETWSDSFLSSFQFWIGWLAICGTALGLLAAIATLLARQESNTRSSVSELQRTTRLENAEKALEATRTQLIIAQSETKAAHALATKAEIAAKPKPFKERLETLLASIDSRIVPELRTGRPVTFTGYLKPWLYAEMQKISTEPEGRKWISMKPGPKGFAATTDGMLTDVVININPGF